MTWASASIVSMSANLSYLAALRPWRRKVEQGSGVAEAPALPVVGCMIRDGVDVAKCTLQRARLLHTVRTDAEDQPVHRTAAGENRECQVAADFGQKDRFPG